MVGVGQWGHVLDINPLRLAQHDHGMAGPVRSEINPNKPSPTSTYHSSEPTENVGRNPILRKTLQGILAVHLKILTTAWDSGDRLASHLGQ